MYMCSLFGIDVFSGEEIPPAAFVQWRILSY